MSRRTQILLPVLLWGALCGLALCGAAFAFLHDSYYGMVLIRAVLAGCAYATTLEWMRAEAALVALRDSPAPLSPTSAQPAEDLQ
ncbi:hypothetical protein [Stenotrophomonas sp. 278]|uniref:hypothetical protein n=1 Tax=Stenotrophomonas sp. 278 TaxID=2479851 RepID=UPI000F66C788|nr:hypothetical protein [Stenotrophomonas sp. 278]RRU23610.1 hypothetical protein EGJ34_02915 [Stenotrophomonas sp. 278]